MLILDLWGISFHPVVVVGSGNDLLFNFIVGHCGLARQAANIPHIRTWYFIFELYYIQVISSDIDY